MDADVSSRKSKMGIVVPVLGRGGGGGGGGEDGGGGLTLSAYVPHHLLFV